MNTMTRGLRWLATTVSRSALFGFAVATATAAAPALCADRAVAAPLQTYYYLVFSNPTDGQDAEYNRWYEAQHIPDVLSIPGFVSAERFRLNEVQMYPGVKVEMPRYLVSYLIRSPDIDPVMKEVSRRLQTGETVISPAFDKKTSLAYLYRATTSFRRTTPDPTRATPGDRVHYLHIVFTYPRPDRVDRFDSWYDKVHAPNMMRGPGYTSAQRAVLAQPAHFASIEPSDTIALFRLSLPANMPIDQAREVPQPGTVPAPEILDLTRNRGYSYRSIGKVVMAAPIQAARAAAKPRARVAPVPPRIPLARNAAAECTAIFQRIADLSAQSPGAQNALAQDAEESGCLE